ncbi:hypothetical protein PYW07_016967 [Mythimna separata]|uniref:Multiple inositol polyphosphate phosphatase 1 n=1 Tax=Mythimna separata TaxID=271217 RepID=A0AAD7YWU0_MYTSE|nr:hypothetical protein PYW07_016967 [Mythimna separata]
MLNVKLCGKRANRSCVRIPSPVQPVSPSLRPRAAAFPVHLSHSQTVFPESSRAKKMWCLLLLVLAAASGEETCFSTQNPPYFLFGDKTSYLAANVDRSAIRTSDIPALDPAPDNGCKPIAFWMLARHGSHNPEANEIDELMKLGELRNDIVTNYQQRNFATTNQRFCDADLELLKQWQWNTRINKTFAGDLTSEGYMMTQQLAQFMKNRFPTLLTTNRKDYLFKFADDRRSKTSFKAFSEGLFGDQAEAYDIPKENNEKLLRPYKFCPSWVNNVGDNNDTLTQVNIFESKMDYKQMLTNISLRLGFNYEKEKDIILRIYQMCRYNKAWDESHNLRSPWCAAFTREDLKRLEYAEDLAAYYKYGYGNPLNKDVGCTTVKDFMTFFEQYVGKDEVPANVTRPRSMIQFTEAATLLTTLTAMGAHKDSAPLTGDNYHSAIVQSRKWTTSNITPFNANLAAVLYKCTQNGNFQVHEEYQVLFLENERTMDIPDCRVGLCDWSLVKKHFGDVANKCDLQFCSNGNKLNSLTAISFAAIAFVVRYAVM